MDVTTASQQLDAAAVALIVATCLEEDVGRGDVTTDALVPAQARCMARLLLKEPGVVCGLPVARALFAALDGDVQLDVAFPEGALVDNTPAVLAELSGSARAVLTGERSALNLVAHLSGVATLTRRYVDAVDGTGATILDTRKTTPGLRTLEKYAVRCGGGANHRRGLDDAILVKDNHLELSGSIAGAVAALRAAVPGRPVELEAESLADVREALAAGVERILLDNMTPASIAQAVELVAGRAELEASGGITLATVRAYAETGVDFISVGALTRSAPALDVSLELHP